MKFVPSIQQKNYFDWIVSGSGSTIVEAVAGSGKTTTLIKGLEYMEGTIFFGAFNKKIADEIQSKCNNLKKDGLKIATMHSIGLSIWKKHCKNPKIKVDQYKCRTILDEIIDYDDAKFIKSVLNESHVDLKSVITSLVSLAKQYVFLPDINSTQDWENLIDFFDLDTCGYDEFIIQYAKDLLKVSNDKNGAIIDFDDMIYAPLIHKNVKFEKFDWVLIDEAQDTNESRRLLAINLLAPNGRLVAVGDKCQPLGTKVTVCRNIGTRWNDAKIEQVNIEDIKIGDKVVSYRSSDCAWVSSGKTVTGITRRPFVGELITIKTESEKISKYTPNHLCFVNFNSLRDKWAVYMMKKDNNFRIGMCKMNYKNSSGVSKRMHDEGADCSWILTICDTNDEAYYIEQAISGKYGLPQLLFNPLKLQHNNSNTSVPKVWNYIGDNSENAIKCLTDFGRYLDYPLFVTGTMEQQTIKRPIVTYACNLINGVLVLPYKYTRGNAHASKSDWEPIIVRREPYCGDVVSINVEDTHLYVADEILTHNCQAIYGFTGASSDALDQIATAVNASYLPLTVSYRCPINIVKHAQTIVSHIQHYESAIEGEVKTLANFDDVVSTVSSGDAILCRFNAPLLSMVYTLIKNGIPAKVEGKDFGKNLKTIIKRCNASTYNTIRIELSKYHQKEIDKYTNSMRTSMIGVTDDKFKCIEIIIDRVESIHGDCKNLVDKICQEIDNLFYDNGNPLITLSTVHKAKGREWDRVFILKSKEVTWITKDWQSQAEKNIKYVAITRAKKELIYIPIQEKEK